MPDAADATMLYRHAAFEVGADRVREGDLEAIAEVPENGPARIRSSYLYRSALEPHRLAFKFALNARDNEAPPGRDHVLYLTPHEGRLETPVYGFGEIDPPPRPAPLVRPLRGAFDVTFRLDLGPVLEAFRREGAYRPPVGPPIREDDFEGVYLAGSESPLVWDFEALGPKHRLHDTDGDGIYTCTLTFELGTERPFDDEGYAVWTERPRDAREDRGYPSYHSPFPLLDALHRLSVEELHQNVRADGAFATGAEWPDVWTRDAAYSIRLALGLVDPEASRRSLMAKTRDGFVVQDTGTGGAWPVSTDRTTWALAAREVYHATGDRAWLRTAYDHLRRTAEADLHAAHDPASGLFFGESSFLDWREQTYPAWMEPADIYRSQCLGTNVVHATSYRILADFAARLGEDAARWQRVAERTERALDRYLWDEARGVYHAYRYGRNHLSRHPGLDALGAALAVVEGVGAPARAERVVAGLPLVPYGVPSIHPQIPNVPPYHNDGIWPFVVAFAAWAGAEVRHAGAVEHTLAALFRAAALFLTNKENMVATSGDFEGTQVNSDRQLWSVAGLLATVYRVFFGIRMQSDRLLFRPFVPAPYAGRHRLEGLRYRRATLDVTLEGHGARLTGATLDGDALALADGVAALPADLDGRHTLVLTLDGRLPEHPATVAPVHFMPLMPRARLADGRLRWDPVEGAERYEVVCNGAPHTTTEATEIALDLPDAPDALEEWQVRAVGRGGLRSFLSEPARRGGAVAIVQPPGELASEVEGYSGPGYRVLDRAAPERVEWEVEVERAGRYAVDVRFANGSGPITTGSCAAVRTLVVGEQERGVVVMPQRGHWDDWGYSSPVHVDLAAGRHRLALAWTPLDENMSRTQSRCLLDHLRLTRLVEA